MTRQALRKLNKIAKAFDCKVVESDGFCYWYADSLIEVTDKPLPHDDEFLALCRECGLDSRVNVFTISFFHEIGHNETLDEVDDMEDTDLKESLSMRDYFFLEEEYIATEWAIDYCNSHIKMIEKLQKALDKYNKK